MSKTIVEMGDRVVYHTTNPERKLMEDSNQCNVQSVLPAWVVAVWSEKCVNLKVSVDGNIPDLWITSAHKGHLEGQWEFQGEYDWEKEQGRR
jgi:hypothetical protein